MFRMTLHIPRCQPFGSLDAMPSLGFRPAHRLGLLTMNQRGLEEHVTKLYALLAGKGGVL
jgi:hypothetical protein